MTEIEGLKSQMLDGLRNRLNSASTVERSAFVMAKIRQIRATSRIGLPGKTDERTNG